MEIQIELLKIAKKDLQAARFLYTAGLYPQAVFFFQQSVEKANKSFGLHAGILKEENLYGYNEDSINHEPIKLYKILIDSQVKKLEQQNAVFNTFPKIKSTRIFKKISSAELLKKENDILSYIKEVRKEKRNPNHISLSEIHQIIREIKQSNRTFEKDKRNSSRIKFTKKHWNDMRRDFSELYNALPERAKTNPKVLKELKKDFESIFKVRLEKMIRIYVKTVCEVIPPYVTLFYLSIITIPHTDITRYPSNSSTPIKIYTKKLPIVKMLPKLIDIQSKVLKRVENIQQTYGNLIVKKNN